MTIKTDRLTLRPWKESDAPSLFELAKDPDVGPMCGWAPHKDVEESRNTIKNILNGKECYAICLKGKSSPIGAIEIFVFSSDRCELGFWIGRPYWGNGYVVEAGNALIDRAFKKYKLKAVICGHISENAKSARAQEKLGFMFDHLEKGFKRTLLGDTKDMVHNILTRQMWLANKTRATWKRGDDARDADKKEPKSVKAIKNISYGKYGKYSLLDIYYPKDGEGKKLPTIVSCHGGGYFYGTKETYYFYCLSLARRGFRVVSFNYRLAPEYPYPAAAEDANEVFRFMVEHQNEYGFDLGNLFLVGDSAGGNLVGHLCTLYTNKEYQKFYPQIDFANIKIKGAAINCGYFSWTGHEDREWYDWVLTAEVKKKYKDALDYRPYINKNYPPVIIASCKGDFLLYEAKPFDEFLNRLGVESHLFLYMPRIQNLGHVYHVNVGHKWSDLWNDDQCNFFKDLMKR